MSTSTLLAVTEVGATQNNKAVTINNAIAALEQAGNAVYENLTAGGSQINVNEATFTRYVSFRFDGVSADIDVTFPSTVGGSATNRLYVVHNDDSAQTITLKDSSETGTTITLGPDTAVVVIQKGINLYRAADQFPALAAAYPYDMSLFIPGAPGDGVIGCTIIAARDFTLADDFAGSRGNVGTNPTATAAFDVAKNGSSIGSISISTGGVFTFATTGGGVTMTAGDRLTITNPSPADATLADVAIVLKGTRTGV